MAKGRQSFMFQEMPCLSISMERRRAIKYIKKQLVQLKCCFFLLLSCLLAARIRKLSNFPPSTASFRKSFYRWGVFLLLLLLFCPFPSLLWCLMNNPRPKIRYKKLSSFDGNKFKSPELRPLVNSLRLYLLAAH